MSDLSPLLPLAAEVIGAAKEAGLTIATAESCTAGLIIGVLTEIAGSSAVVDRGYITYSNGAKSEMVGVPAELIDRAGAVSRDVAIAMVAGALARSGADLAVSVTGIAGPGGGSDTKPVGLVHFGAARRGAPVRHVECRFGDIGRSEVRLATVRQALTMLREMI